MERKLSGTGYHSRPWEPWLRTEKSPRPLGWDLSGNLDPFSRVVANSPIPAKSKCLILILVLYGARNTFIKGIVK